MKERISAVHFGAFSVVAELCIRELVVVLGDPGISTRISTILLILHGGKE
jgi:hypothetical protein